MERNDRIITVEGYDASLHVERGHLVIRDGFNADDRREIRFRGVGAPSSGS